MSTQTLETPVSRAELELLLRAALLTCGPAQVGRDRARRQVGRLTAGLLGLAAAVAAYDLTLLAAA